MQRPLPVAVAVRFPAFGAFMLAGTDPIRHLEAHQLVQNPLHQSAQEILAPLLSHALPKCPAVIVVAPFQVVFRTFNLTGNGDGLPSLPLDLHHVRGLYPLVASWPLVSRSIRV